MGIELHGATVREARTVLPITIPSGPNVIGLVGSAPDAQAAIAASAAIGDPTTSVTLTAVSAGPEGNTITCAIVIPDAIERDLAVSLSGRDITVSLEVDGTAASVAFGDLTLTAQAKGPDGNTITCALLDPGANSAALSVELSGRDITVNLATSNAGAITSTAAQVKAALDANADIAALVTTAAAGAGVMAAAARTALAGGTGGVVASTAAEVKAALDANADIAALVTTAAAGAGVMAAAARTALAGGTAEVAPLDTPALILPADVPLLGGTGELALCARDVLRTCGQQGATIVAVRTEDDSAPNIAGSAAAGTGLYALRAAEGRLGVRPRVVGTGIKDTAAGLAVQAVARGLRAIPLINLRGSTRNEAVMARRAFNESYCLWPDLVILDQTAGGLVTRPQAGLVAGHIARVGAAEGWSKSPSNRTIENVVRTAVPVDWDVSGVNTLANILNQNFITTVVRRPGAGLVLWGNRLANGSLMPHRRVRDLVADGLLDAIVTYIDADIDVPFVSAVLKLMRGFLRSQRLRRVIGSGSRAYFDPSLNSASDLAANRITFSFALALKPVAEMIIFQEQVIHEEAAQILAAELAAAA